jgi:hypothetical protein
MTPPNRLAWLVALVAAAGCTARSQFEDCAVACTATTGCPSGLACSVDGYCRAPGAGGTCAGLAPDGGRDGSIEPEPVDAGPDAGPQTLTLTQTATTTLALFSLATCWDVDSGDTEEQSWYRVFALADHGIVGRPFHVESVTVGIEESDGTPSIRVRVGTYGGAVGAVTLDPAKLTVLASRTVTVPETSGTRLAVPITATIPADGNLAIEVHANDLVGMTRSVFIGTTTSAETRFGYIRAPVCGLAVPSNAVVMDPTHHIVITATGWY